MTARPAEATAATDASRSAALRTTLWARRGALTTLLALLLWWPVGFDGTARWFHLPLSVTDADQVFLGALAAAIAVGVLVPAPWPRFLVVAGYSGLGWFLSVPPEATQIPHQRLSLAVALTVGGLLGLALGSRAQAGVGPLASALAVLSPLCLVGWLQGPLLAVALALPFLTATRDRVAPTVLAVVRVLVLWLGTGILAVGLRYGWDTVRPGVGLTPDRLRSEMLDSFKLLVRQSWDDIARAMVAQQTTWLWVAAALAVVVISLRASRAMTTRASSTG